MPKREVLSRERIIAAAEEVIRLDGPEGLTLRRLGDALGVNNTALYRHFRNKDELLRMLADRSLEGVVTEDQQRLGWREAIIDLCGRLRAAHFAQPDMSTIVQAGPTRQQNELRITESLLHHLARAGFPPRAAAEAYHAIIELTVGAASIDAPIARTPPPERTELYAGWRREYAALDPATYPETARHAGELYLGTAGRRFFVALEALLDGMTRWLDAPPEFDAGPMTR